MPLRFLAIVIILCFFTSCGNDNFRSLSEITGRSGDLLVVMDTAFKSTLTGESVMEVFASEQFGLPQREPLFNIVIVPHKAFTRILQTSRNVLSIQIKPSNKPGFSIQKNVWAKGQVVMNIVAPNDISASEIIRKNGDEIINYLQKAELERLHKNFEKIKETKSIKEIETMFGITLTIPSGYSVVSKKENYICCRQDKKIGEHLLTQCISIWSYPFVSDSTFTLKNIITVRDSVTKLYQQSLAKSAYMEIYKEMMPQKNEINMNGKYAVEIRGLWSMVNDFMGGPFVNYTFVDEKNAKVICVDGYVFAPQFDKREYLRELEAIGRSAEIVPLSK